MAERMDLSKTLTDLIENNSRTAEVRRSKIVGDPPELAADEFLVHHPDAVGLADRFRIERRGALPRSYAAESLRGLCELVHELQDSGEFSEEKDPIVVMVSASSVKAVLGERTRRGVVGLELEKTEGYEALANKGVRAMEHQAFVDCLRLCFRNEVAPGDFVPAVKKLKFNRAQSGYSEVAVGRESMGNSVNAEALADGQAIPEEVTLTVQVFENIDESVSMPGTVRCGVLMNLRESKLGLQPMAGELHGLMGKTLDDVATWLRANLPAGMTVINGVDVP